MEYYLFINECVKDAEKVPRMVRQIGKAETIYSLRISFFGRNFAWPATNNTQT